jgi:transcriptional regulator with XRE-family HTH domain
MYLQNIGANIRDARVDQRLSRQDLADASGVSDPALALIEHGEQHPSLSTVAKLASVLRVNLPDLAEASR